MKAVTDTSKSHPALKDPELSIAESRECIRDMYSAFPILTLSLCILLWTLFPLAFSQENTSEREEKRENKRKKKEGKKEGRKKEKARGEKGRTSEPQRENGRIRCSRRVFKGLAEVTKECSAHQRGRMRDQKEVPELLGCPSWSFLLLGLGCRLCRTGGSPAGWQDLGWVQMKRRGEKHSLSLK